MVYLFQQLMMKVFWEWESSCCCPSRSVPSMIWHHLWSYHEYRMCCHCENESDFKLYLEVMLMIINGWDNAMNQMDSIASCTTMATPLAGASSSPWILIDHLISPSFSLLGTPSFQHYENCQVILGLPAANCKLFKSKMAELNHLACPNISMLHFFLSSYRNGFVLVIKFI